MTHNKKKLNVPLWVCACLAGGICGALNTYVLTSLTYLPISGMAISLVLAVLSYVFGDSESE
jgi:hypothetical protein